MKAIPARQTSRLLLPRDAPQCRSGGRGRHGGASLVGSLAGALVIVCLGVGCGSSRPAPAAVAPEPGGPSISFSFETLDGKLVDSASTRGRATAVLFVTTYDLASQVEAQRLEDVIRVHTPRANGVLVVLEAQNYTELAAAFRDSLGLTLPTAMADPSTLDGTGPFGPIPRIPTLVVLDREGHETWRRPGVVTHGDIEKALATASDHGN